MSRSVVILGSTGSIGESALAVVRALAPELRITGLAAGRNWRRVLEQAEAFGVERVALADASAARACREAAPAGVRVLGGSEGVKALAAETESDTVLCAIVGMAGLGPVLAAIEAGREIALATKEVLVAAGGLVVQRCRESGCALLPVDSEHNAIFQCLCGAGAVRVPPIPSSEADRMLRRIVLTASGGPFAGRPEVDLDRVTPEQALDHPRWDMGPKVTIDSATLMNKGLELIEAHWLFGLPDARIDIVIHPESIVHSMIELVDGSTLAQLSVPDMRFAIQHALTFPARVDGGLPGLDPVGLRSLRFAAPDEVRFPCLRLAREAMRRGGTLPAVMNAANEAAVEAFLNKRIGFSEIWKTVECVMARHGVTDAPDLETILGVDAEARRGVRDLVAKG